MVQDFRIEALRSLRGAKPREYRVLMALILGLDDRNVAYGTRAELADLAQVHRETFREAMAGLTAKKLARYDRARHQAEVHPRLAFIGSEQERMEAIRRWRERENREEEDERERKRA